MRKDQCMVYRGNRFVLLLGLSKAALAISQGKAKRSRYGKTGEDSSS